MAVSVGDAVLKLGVDTKDLDKGLKGIKGTIQKHSKAIGIAMTAAGGAILAIGALSVKAFAQMGDEVQKMALRTGFSTEALSELRHAAELSGTALSSLEKASKTLSGAILDAGFGLETYVRAFDKIGLSYEQLKGLSPEDQFLAVMEALAGLTDESEKAALAADIFGRAGTQLLPMLANGTEGLKAMRQEAHDLGIVFDQEAANKAAEFNDALTRLKGAVSGIKMEIGGMLADALKPMIDKIKEVVASISNWMKEHPALAKALIMVTGAVGGLMLVLGPLLIILPHLVTGFALMKSAILGFIPRVIALTTALWAKVAALIAATIAMGPVGWALAATSMALITTGLILLHQHHNKQLEELTETTEETTDATDDLTESVQGQATAYRDLTATVDRYFASLRRPEVVREPILGVKQRAALVTEMMRWGELAKTAESVEQRKFYMAQAAAMSTRLQGFEQGGIAMRPMLARIGEQAPRIPEAVIPLDKLEGMMGGKTVSIFVELDGRVIAQAIGQPLVDEIRLRIGAHI